MKESTAKKICIGLTLLLVLLLYIFVSCYDFIKLHNRLGKTHKELTKNVADDNTEIRYILTDKDNKPVNNKIYKMISGRDTFVVTLENNRQGVINKQGEYIIPPDYTKITTIKIDNKPYYKTERIIYSEDEQNPVFKKEQIIFDEEGRVFNEE